LEPDVRRGGYNRIVFCENSGADLSFLRELVTADKAGAVEFLSLSPSEFNSRLGKSYNEEKIIDLACDKSRFLADDIFFFKVTGRYSILNINHFIKDIRRKLPELDFYCDVKDHHVFSSLGLKWRQTWCDTRHIGFRVSFWRSHVYGREDELLRGNMVFENQMFALSRQVRDNPRTSHRCRQDIFIDGLNGSPGRCMHLLGVPIPERYQRSYFILNSVVADFRTAA